MTTSTSVAEELNRVLALPVVDKEHFSNAWMTWSVLLRKHPDAPPLNNVQGSVLEHLHQAKPPAGVFAKVPVGKGKTLMAMLAPVIVKAKRPLLILPTGLDEEFDREFEKWSEHYQVVRPQIITYNQLSRKEGAHLLTRLNPDMIICDEAHKLRYMSSARTKRFVRYLKEKHDKGQGVRLVVTSGTMTGGSLSHFAHLLLMALHEGSPAPLDLNTITAWATVLDLSQEAEPENYKAMEPLLDWSGTRNFEAAFHVRMAATPGVVVAYGSSCDSSIHIRRLTGPPPPPEIEAAIAAVENDWELPNGELITEAPHKASACRALASGFWFLPGEVPSLEWEYARREWCRELRTLKEYRSRAGFDSPALIEEVLRESSYAGYRRAQDALFEWDKHRHLVRPDSEPVWLAKSWLIDAATDWVTRHKEGILWYHSIPVGDALREAGFDVRGAGDPAPHKGEKVVALSISRFKEGYNLQQFNKMLVLQPPPSNSPWQQLIGRCHREGQLSDQVTIDVLQRTRQQTSDFDSARLNAGSVQRYEGEPQKLLLATRQWVR